MICVLCFVMRHHLEGSTICSDADAKTTEDVNGYHFA